MILIERVQGFVMENVFEHGVPPGGGLDRDGYIEQLQANIESKFPMQMLGIERSLEQTRHSFCPLCKTSIGKRCNSPSLWRLYQTVTPSMLTATIDSPFYFGSRKLMTYIEWFLFRPAELANSSPL